MKGQVNHCKQAGNSQKTEAVTASAQLINVLLALLPEAAKNWLRFNEYFLIIYQFALLGWHARKLLIEKKVIAIFGDLFLG